jgi:large subunit ribosomal protein L4
MTMISAKKFNSQGDEAGTAELSETVFGERVHEHVLWLSVKAYLANQRQGNAHVKSRGNVRGGGKKPWRQKGTGMARAGTRRSPIWVGGGRAFGPRTRDYTQKLPRKVKSLSLRSALSLKAGDGALWVIEDPSFDKPHTKTVAAMLDKMGTGDAKTLIVTHEGDRMLYLSSRNLPRVRVSMVGQLNAYDLLNCDNVVITDSAVKKVEEVHGS